MPADRADQFRADLQNDPVTTIVRRHLIYGQCAQVNDVAYFTLKNEIVDFLKVHPNEVVVVGSAKLGFSIVPDKRYQEFGDRSDIDVAIVSHKCFDRVWLDVFEYDHDAGYWPKKDAFSQYLLRGWIRPDKLPTSKKFAFGNGWFEFFRGLAASGRFGDIKVSGGLYREWVFLERYQSICVEKCKQAEVTNRANDGHQ